MKNFGSQAACVIVLTLLAVMAGCSSDHGGGGSKPSTSIVISGSVNDSDIPNATVSLKRIATDETLGTATCDSSGAYRLSVVRADLVSDDYVMIATHPSNGRILRSFVAGAEITAVTNTYSSNLTVISPYTEAAYLVAKTRNNSENPLEFLKQSILLTGLNLPKSTGYDAVDALGSWIKGQFTNTETAHEDSYTVGLLWQILSVHWPVFFVTGSEFTMTLPKELTTGGAILSVQSFDGADSVSVEGGMVTVTPGASGTQGQVVLQVSLNGTSKDVTLPVNTVGSITTTEQTLSAGDTTSVTFGNLVVIPDSGSFSASTSMVISQLDLSDLSDTSMGDVTITAAFDIDLSREPKAPVTLIFQAQGTPNPDKTVLIHINSATKYESYVYPDSYDEATNRFKFTLNSFSPVLIGTISETPAYEAGTSGTVSHLEFDSVRAFAFFRDMADVLLDEGNLSDLNSVTVNEDACVRYITLLSSEALASFMDLPITDPDGLDALAETTFKPQWFSLAPVNAYDEYYTIRARLMQALYRVANSPFEGISRNQLLDYANRHSVDIEADINAIILGQPDVNDDYYPPIVAYRVLKSGVTSPDTFFQNALSAVNDLGLEEEAYQIVCHDMADWLEKYINYKRYTSPKVVGEGKSAAQLLNVRSSLIEGARSLFSDPALGTYAGLWLGGSYTYSETNDVTPAIKGFDRLNDTLGNSVMFTRGDQAIQAKAKNDTVYPLGSSVNGRTWVDQGSYYLPPEVNDEITNLNNWRTYLISLLPEVSTWYRDGDGDGFGDPNNTTEASLRPDGYVADNTDPDDTNASIYPDSREICGDGVDNDLNGLTDEGCSSFYKGTETTISLQRKSNNQFLIPVDVGNQTLNLLVDTGSDALLVFADKLAEDTTVAVSNTPFTKRYASTTREGFLAQAGVRLGAYYDPDMTIMVVTSPTSANDPSLTAKEADGIIGLRRTQGISVSSGEVHPDAPLNELQPSINIFELNLPPTGPASLSLGHMTILDRAKSQYVFKAKTYTFEDPERPYDANYADLQIPFRAKSKFGKTESSELDMLFDSGAVSKLVLDTQVAKSLGYDPFTETWTLDEDDEIEFNLVGAADTITIYPKFKVSEISVAPLSQMGVTYEAVLGIDRWQHYVVGYSYVDYQSGGPDGTILMLFRPNLAEAYNKNLPDKVWNYDDIEGLNSFGDDRFPTADNTGNLIAFQSNRPNGMGGWDIYMWEKGTGLLTYPNLNSTADDADPSLSGDGRYMVFHSNRDGGTGNWDIYLYDVENRVFVEIPGLNSTALDRTPTISTDGRYIAFRSERESGEGGSDIYLYDRETETLVDLPGLNSPANDYDPVVNEDGTLIAFDHEYTVDGVLESDIYLYNVATLTLDTLPYANWGSWDMDAVVSPDGTYMTCQSNWYNIAMGLYDRNFEIYNLTTGLYETFSGLNSEFDEEGLCFTGNGQNILFHSSRNGGMGGSDIYFYSLTAEEKTSQDTTVEKLPDQQIPLGFDEKSGTYTLSVTTEDGDALTLLLDTGVSGVMLFSDSAPSGKNCGGPTAVSLPYGILNASTQICMQITVGDQRADTMIPVLSSQSEYNALTGRSDLPDVDGVIGFRGNFQNEFMPKIQFIEYSFVDGDDVGLDAKPGLTLGAMPMVSLARGQGEYVFDTEVDGVIDPIDPVDKSYTNMDVTFFARADTGETSHDSSLVMLSTVLHDTLVLDFETARSLGYSEVTGWGMVNEISLFFANDYYMLPVDMGAFPVSRIQVADLSDQHCNAVLSADRWIGNFFVGFATIDFQFGGPNGTVTLLHVKDLPAIQDDYLTQGRNYLALPGLNSESDEDYPTISIDGQTLAFQSTRNGDKDVFVYKVGKGLQALPGLNSDGDDEYPYISGNGRLVTFHSARSGSLDIYLYDIETLDFIDLPGLNTEYDESMASISADGTMIAFHSDRPDSVEGSEDVYLYSLTDMAMVSINGSWLNTHGAEYAPVLTQDASLVSFIADHRPDSMTRSGTDIFVYDLAGGRLLELPEEVNEGYWNDGIISVDGDFILGTFYPVETGDIRLFERSSGEFIYLPGLNTIHNEWATQASPNAQYIVFESDRPGGVGGWDIYVYQRDETDTNTYTVTNSYDQSGYVTDEYGNRMASEEIRAYDKTGELIGTAITDGDGNFTLTVPQGSQLGISFESVTTDLSIVTDDVGDDTYVPDFEAGNLKFTEVWIEDTAQAGLSSTIHFDIEATVPKYNSYITVYLKAGNPGDVVVDETFVPDYELTSLLIDKLGFRGTVTEPVIKEQKDTITSINYLPDTNNKKAYVEHTFIVPQGIPDGVYTAVFAINTYDVTVEDDALQGESNEDLADNYMVASAATIIGTADLPNLRILSHKLYTNSFELPAAIPDSDVVPELYDLNLNLEVESMAQDTAEPVDITFNLEVEGVSYPMSIAESDGYSGLVKADKQTYDVTCRPEDREGYPSGDRCASLFRQEQTGKTYSLFMNKDAYNALKDRTTDTMCNLVVQVDPDLTISEYNDNLDDNTVTLPVMFLAPEPERTASARTSKMGVLPGSTKDNLFNLRTGKEYGNSDFGIGFEIGPKMDYMQVSFDGYDSPYAVDFNGTGKVTAKIFGSSVTPLEVGPKFDFDFSEGGLKNSYFEYGVWTFGLRVWGYKHTMPNEYTVKGSLTLWDSKDNNGNEKYAKRKKKTKKKTFNVGGIPVTVEGGLIGEIGFRGAIILKTGNLLSAEVGPYASVVGMLEGSLGAPGFQVGVGVELTLLDLGLKLNPTLMVKPEVPIAIFEFRVPVTIDTLSGNAYLFARSILWTVKHYIIAWQGYNYEINLFPLWYKGYGATDLYNSSYYPKSDFTGTPIAGEREGFLSIDWEYGGPSELNGQVDNFSAVFEGYFEFSNTDSYIWGANSAGAGSDYTFYVKSDDYLTIKLDDEDILTDNFGQTQFTQSVTAGFHKLTVNYKELHSPAHLQVYWTSPNQFATFYYNNTDLSGDPVLFETTDRIDMKLGSKSPKPNVVNDDNFSIKYEGDFTFPVTADYIFSSLGDDVVRIYVDDVLVLNNNGVWYAPAYATTNVTAGNHKVRVEYIEYTGWANLKVGWAPKNTFAGAYYNNRTFSKTPVRISDDGGYFKADPGLWERYFLADFGHGRPASDTNVNYDNFSTRWEGAFYFEGGEYEFVTALDNEISVWVDDKLLGSYGAWGQAHLMTANITPGWHIIRMNYVEHDGRAMGSLKWGKKQKNIVTEYFVYGFDENGNRLTAAINRRNNMNDNWGGSAPEGDFPLQGDNYQVHWEGDFDFEGAPYRFKSGGDDIVKVYLDNIKVVEAAWRDWHTFDYSVIAMNPGIHHVKVEFTEHGGGAWAQVGWDKLEPNKFYGKKFDASASDAQYDINTTSNVVDYDWEGGSEIGSTDNHLIVWNGVFDFETDGTYRFYGSVDDDLHVYIDNVHVHHRGSWGTYSFEKKLKKGPHSIKLRYWEGGGNSHISFRWERK